ncbi:MAG TPA: GspH/FimT family pseudopilin [Thermoanaerobaculia bacterium]|nr:GspH/FimT family pseudopilin [Thermoanaerobaculia bacterium]
MVCPGKERGLTLIELLTVIAIIGIGVAVAVPSWMSLRRRAAVRSAAAEIRSVFHETRSRAIAGWRNSGVRFTPSGTGWQFAIYDDGDRDGVRNDDIRNGVDVLVAPPRHLFQQPQLVTIGLLPQTIRDPDGDPLRPGDSPVQFNRSSICSFTPLGTSTAGTIYLTDDAGSLYAVRVFAATAKIRLVRYDGARRRWEDR